MTTPKKFQRLISKRIITKEMLEGCLYSANNRAKDFHNEVRRCKRPGYADYEYKEWCRESEDEFYAMKDKLLSIVQPTCIHLEYVEETQKIFEYEPEYYEVMDSEDVIYEDGDYDRELGEYVEYIVARVKEPHYYLFYDLGGAHTFRTPIFNPDRYDLPVVETDRRHTKVVDLADLLSIHFLQKVIGVIESGDYTYLPD